ncbi:hypothetical protein, partial [Xanthovirga aplysinae]|uniref:hypothetical protein n=1 Tax=Xanthovirga aplysinae TaxID=2529853 RepID=UPI003CCCDBF0
KEKVEKENPPVQASDISPNQMDIYGNLEKEKLQTKALEAEELKRKKVAAKKEKQAAKRNIVVLPFDSERFANKWTEWVEARVKEKKQKPYTQT